MDCPTCSGHATLDETPRLGALPAGPARPSAAVPAPQRLFVAELPETIDDIDRDVAAVTRLGAVPTLLRVLCESTGMGFAAVARVSAVSWTACAVFDRIGFGILPGVQLALDTTLCRESRDTRAAIVIEHASEDPAWCDHPTPRLYAIESYASFPIVLADGSYFGNLCCIDPRPARIDEPKTRAMFERFAELIGTELDDERQREATRSALSSEQAHGLLREQFIAILGHDLRNPLAAISACAQLLKLQPLDARSTRLLDQVRTNVNRMAVLIDDTLDLARGRLGGGLSLNLAWNRDVGGAIEEVIEAARIANPGRRIHSSIVVDRAVRCDVARIQQVASNLIGNAIVHGAADGDIVMRARCDGAWFELSAWNAGEPIPPEAMSRLFEPFWRQPSDRHREGLGLGLHICSEIAKAHGGSMSASSSAGQGTAFFARLPIAGPA